MKQLSQKKMRGPPQANGVNQKKLFLRKQPSQPLKEFLLIIVRERVKPVATYSRNGSSIPPLCSNLVKELEKVEARKRSQSHRCSISLVEGKSQNPLLRFVARSRLNHFILQSLQIGQKASFIGVDPPSPLESSEKSLDSSALTPRTVNSRLLPL